MINANDDAPKRCCFQECRAILRTRENNNAYPMYPTGAVCCDACNRSKVIRARAKIVQRSMDFVSKLCDE